MTLVFKYGNILLMGENYPNHYKLKKNRKWLLTQIDDLCFFCGGKATQVHHLDWTRNNHEIENLLPLCFSCHSHLHYERRRELLLSILLIKLYLPIKKKIEVIAEKVMRTKKEINLLRHFSHYNHYGLSNHKFQRLEREGRLDHFIKICFSLPQTLTKEELKDYYSEVIFSR